MIVFSEAFSCETYTPLTGVLFFALLPVYSGPLDDDGIRMGLWLYIYPRKTPRYGSILSFLTHSISPYFHVSSSFDNTFTPSSVGRNLSCTTPAPSLTYAYAPSRSDSRDSSADTTCGCPVSEVATVCAALSFSTESMQNATT